MPASKLVGGEWRASSGFLVNYDSKSWTNASNRVLRTDSVTKGADFSSWRERLAMRLPATTTLSGRRYGSKGQSIGYFFIDYAKTGNPNSHKYGEFEGDYWGTLLAHPSNPSALSTTTADNAAKRAVVASILRVQRQMQGLVFIGEIREAVRMIRNPFRLLNNNVWSFLRMPWRRLGLETPKKFHERVADAWLERSFGWSPLISDIDAGCRAVEALSREQSPSRSVRGRGQDFRRSASIRSSADIPVSCTGSSTRWTEDEVSVRYHGIVAVDPPTWIDGVHRFGISLHDVIPAMWELIPYSFLADYFTNLGDIIEAASLNRSSLKWLERGIRTKVTACRTLDASVTPLDNLLYRRAVSHQNCVGEYRSWCETVSRIDYTALSLVPSLQFEIPGLSMKWLNLAALAATHRTRSRQAYA